MEGRGGATNRLCNFPASWRIFPCEECAVWLSEIWEGGHLRDEYKEPRRGVSELVDGSAVQAK